MPQKLSQNLFPIATRRSPLALKQAELVAQALAKVISDDTKCDPAPSPIKQFPIVGLTSTGDKNLSGSLADSGGKGLFTKEIEQALLDGEARFAVHSMKDMPVTLPEGLEIAAIPARQDPRDAFISPCAANIDDLSIGAIIGTASARRSAQVKYHRPDIECKIIRGNINTRLEKLQKGDMAATFLAVAGLNRLNLANHITHIMEIDEMLPAIGQGALCIQTRSDDRKALHLATKLTCARTQICVMAERAFLAHLDGSCKTAMAAHAFFENETLSFYGEYFVDQDRTKLQAQKTINFDQNSTLTQDQRIEMAEEIGVEAAQTISAQISRSPHTIRKDISDM